MEISIPVWVEIKENKYPYQVDKLLEKQSGKKFFELCLPYSTVHSAVDLSLP